MKTGRIIIRVSRILFKVVLALFIVACIAFVVIFKFGGMSYYIILSGSMRPDIDVDDVIVVRDLDETTAAKELEVGDIATYFDGKDRYVTHRVYEKGENDKGDVVFIFKGDNNNVIDKDTVHVSQIRGKYVCNVKGMGGFVEFITSIYGIVTVVAVLFMLFAIDSLLAHILSRMKERDSDLSAGESKPQISTSAESPEDKPQGR